MHKRPCRPSINHQDCLRAAPVTAPALLSKARLPACLLASFPICRLAQSFAVRPPSAPNVLLLNGRATFSACVSFVTPLSVRCSHWLAPPTHPKASGTTRASRIRQSWQSTLSHG